MFSLKLSKKMYKAITKKVCMLTTKIEKSRLKKVNGLSSKKE